MRVGCGENTKNVSCIFLLEQNSNYMTYITLVGKEERVTGAPGKVTSISLSSQLLAVRSIRVV